MRVDFVFVCAKPKRKQMELDDGTKNRSTGQATIERPHIINLSNDLFSLFFDFQ